MSFWPDLVDAAVVGSRRAAPPPPAGVLAGLARDADASDGSQLLHLAAVASRARRAGYVATPADDREAPPAAPADARPAVSPRACRRLDELLIADRTELVAEWLRLLARTSCQPPAVRLPALLDAATRRADLRELLVPVLGPLAEWLAAANPEWSWVVAAVSTDAPDVGAWTTADRRSRRRLLELLRHNDPAAGRELVASTWSSDSARDRAAFLSVLATGLHPGDEPLLDRALADRNGDVRRAAADLLGRLPGSAFSGRAVSRAAHAVQVREAGTAGAQLVVRPPAQATPEMEADGIDASPPRGTGRQAWLLRQVASAPPAAWWAEHTGMAPASLLALAADTKWADALETGWTEAAIRDAHRPWIEALLEERPADEPAAALLAALTTPDRDRWLATHPDSPLFALIGTAQPPWSTAPWSAALSAAVRDRIATIVTADPGRSADARQLLKLAGARLEPPTMPETDPATVHPRLASGLAEMMNTLSVRATMRRELAEEPTP